MNEVIQGHNVAHLATIDSNREPSCGFLFTLQGMTITSFFLLTNKESRKVAHIRQCPRVGFATIDRDAQNREEIGNSKYIKGKGTATIIEDEDELQRAMGALMARFPYLAELPDDPTDFVGIRLSLQEVHVTDHTISFGYIEEIVFS